MGRYDEANAIPNQINAPAPHSEFIVPANYPNQWSLVRKPPKGGGKKPGKKGSNLMDTGPDDYDVAPSAFEQAAEQSTQALSSGQQTLGASPVEQYLQAQATGRQDIGGNQVGTGGQMTPPPGTYGFRERESGPGDLGIAPPPEVATPTAPQQQRSSNLMDTGPDDDNPQRVLASAGGAGNVDRTGIAQGYGYERGTGNFAGLGSLLGAATGIPFVGGLASKGMDALGLPGNYGEHGTTDAMGNVYGHSGRAYDPVTGRAVGSYRSGSDWKNAAFGGYNNLRAAGENPISAGLGSYENSIHNPYFARDNAADARAARLRGGSASTHGLTTTAGNINQNTFEGGQNAVTAGQLGFTNDRAYNRDLVDNNTGVWGTGTGDLAATEFGPGVINESGTISHGGGTVVGLTNTADPSAGNITLLGTSDAAKAAAQEELERRASGGGGGDSSMQAPGTPLSEIPGTNEYNQAQYEKEAYGHQQDSGGGDDSGGGGGK